LAKDTRLIVDRIVDNEQSDPAVETWVVVEWESPTSGDIVTMDLPASWFPEDLSEGDHVLMGTVVDEERTEDKKEEIQDMMKRLMERDNSPPEDEF